jgi:two-component system CheB/CheR fusion protein
MDSITAQDDNSALNLLLQKVHRYGGYDFREYKQGTIIRRLTRRLVATGTTTYPEYTRYLDDYPQEYERLADDLTIKVSGFFRNPYTFRFLSEKLMPGVLAYKKDRQEKAIRFWSIGCAGGEEPYSIAISLSDILVRQRQDFDVSIYATDISPPALNSAKKGVYTFKEVEHLSPALLKRHFVEHDQHYEINYGIKSKVKFSHYDLTSTGEAPFTGLDCIFCCNVLIYLQKNLQEKVLDILYGSLANPGYLILGEVETPTSAISRKLQCLDSKAKVYKKFNDQIKRRYTSFSE